MFHQFDCPYCGRKLQTKLELVRPLVKCPRCSAVFRAPPARRLYFKDGPIVDRITQFMSRSRN